MSKQDSADGRWHDRMVGDPEVPEPEPWFIRDLRAHTDARPADERPGPGTEPFPAMTPIDDRRDEVIAAEPRVEAPEAPVELADPLLPQRRGISGWLAALAVGVLALVALTLWLTRVPRVGGAPEVVSAAPITGNATVAAPAALSPPATTAAAAPDPAAALACARPEMLGRLRSLIVGAAERRGGDARLLAPAVAGLSLSVAGTPDTRAGDEGAVECRGWLTLTQPGRPGTSAQVSFRALVTPDGQPHVSILQGAAPIIAGLAQATAADDVAAAPAREAAAPIVRIAAPEPAQPAVVQRTAARPAEPLERNSDPSFDCRRVTSRANRMICRDDRLAALDRSMASLFDEVGDGADPDTRAELEDGRRDFLARVQRCDEENCIASVYQDRIDELREYR